MGDINLYELKADLSASGFEDRNLGLQPMRLTIFSESGASSIDVFFDGCVQLYFRDLGGYWWRALDIIRKHIDGVNP